MEGVLPSPSGGETREIDAGVCGIMYVIRLFATIRRKICREDHF